MTGGRPVGLVALIAAVMLVGGCLAEGTLEVALPVNLHIWTTDDTVEVDAPGWITDVAGVYLCPSRPPRLPDSTADRTGWTPGGGCQDYGRHASSDGLRISLPVSAIAPADRAAFDAASDWYLLLLDLDGELVSRSVSSQFHAPSRAA